MAGRSEQSKKEVLTEARERFKRGMDWEAICRPRFRDDIKFDAGDARNNYQWPEGILSQRGKKPSMTINRVRQHNLDILNDARQSKVAVKVRPMQDGASYDSAMILDGVIKHIEYISNADTAYQQALAFAVRGGIGYIRLVTDYMDDNTFDQEIFIRRVKDPMSILLDCDILEFDGSDAKWGFEFTEIDRKEWKRDYPQWADIGGDSELAADVSWVMEDKVRIASYYRAIKDPDKLVAFVDPTTGQQRQERLSKLEKALADAVIDDPQTVSRSVTFTRVEHFKIVGDHIIEEKVWPGKYIPILRCIGEETIIDGQLDRKGHTRALIDMQRTLNYNASAAVEYGALQTKIPYMAPMAAIEGQEELWKVANTENFSVLTWKHVDDNGLPIPKPERVQPPASAPVFIQGMKDAVDQMYLASGQNQSDFGVPSNERSGVAIEARQRQGDNATYHYLDHQSSMIRYLGKQLLDLIGKVYDTKRIVNFRDDAGKEGQVTMDPEAPEHFQQQTEEDGSVKAIMNPTLGVYDVQADVGPAYATRRAEAFAAFSQLLGQNKELITLVGDIWMRFSDIPGAEDAAERLKRMVPPQALSDEANPQLGALKQQLQQAQGIIAGLSQKLEDKTGTVQAAHDKNAIAGYDAQTKRLAAVKEALALDPQGLLVLVRELLEEAQATSAGGGALEHIVEPVPQPDGIHPALGGQLQPPQPHAPPIDPNNMITPPAAPDAST